MSQLVPDHLIDTVVDAIPLGTRSVEGDYIVRQVWENGVARHEWWQEGAADGGGGASAADLAALDNADVASGAVVGTNLIITLKDGTTIPPIDVTSLLADVKLVSGSYNAVTKTIDLVLSNGTNVPIPVAALLPVTHDATLSGDGAAVALRVEISTDAGNALIYGTDGKLKVAAVTLDGNDRHVVRANAIPNSPPTAAEVPTPINGDTAKVFLSDRSIEYWSHNGTTWTRNYIDQSLQSAVYDLIFGTIKISGPVSSVDAVANWGNLLDGIPLLTDRIYFASTAGNLNKTVTTANLKTLLATPDPVVDVTGATLPIAFPVATIPGTPVFNPAGAPNADAIYAITNGTSIVYAKWNGTAYISSPAPTTPNVRYGNTAPAVIAGTDKKGDEFILTHDGTAAGAVYSTWVFDGTIWKNRLDRVRFNPTALGASTGTIPSGTQVWTMANGNYAATLTLPVIDEYTEPLTIISNATLPAVVLTTNMIAGASSVSIVQNVPRTFHPSNDGWIVEPLPAAAPDPIVDVTGATLPIVFPIAVIPGAPVFVPATPTDSTVLYAITNGTSIQYAKWNGTQYISAPAPAASPGHFRSGTGATGPDGVNDPIENISRTGNTGFGIADPSTLLFKHELDGTTGIRQTTLANATAVCTIPSTATSQKSAIVVTQTTTDAVLLFADANLAIKAGQRFTVINSDLSTNKISYLGYDIHPNQSLSFVHNGRMWQIEEVGINSDVQLETVTTILPTSTTALNSFTVVAGGIQSSTTTWVEVPGTSFVATTGGEYLVKYVAYASCTGALNTPVVGNGFRIAVGSNIATGSVQTTVPATGRVVPTSESLITNLAAGQIDSYTKSVIVRAKPGETIQLQMNSVVGAQIVYQSATQNSRLEYAKIVNTTATATDEIVNVTGATLPITFPIATLPGAPVFSPAGTPSTDAIYKFANGQLAIWDGSNYQSYGSPVRSNWSSNTTTANTAGLADGVNDLTEKIRRDGLTGINIDPVSTLDVAGSIGYGIVPLSASAAPYTFLQTDAVLSYTGAFAGVGQVTFPAAAAFARRIIGIRMPATTTFDINLISGGGNIELPNYVLTGSARISSAALGYIEWQSDGTIWRLKNYNERKFYPSTGYSAPFSGFTTFVGAGGVTPAAGTPFQIPANATSWLALDGNYIPFVALPIGNTTTGRFSVYANNSPGFPTTVSTANTDLPRDTVISSGSGLSMHFQWSDGKWRWVLAPEPQSPALRYQRRGTYAVPLAGTVTVGADDDLLIVANLAVVALPAPGAPNVDRRINIKKPGAGSVSLLGNIDGVVNRTLTATDESLTMQSDGATWVRI